mgnify:CR=1 FL=1
MGIRLDNARALYLEAIRDGNAAEAIEKYSGSRYTQHSTPVKDGKEGFVEFFADFHRRNPVRDIQIVRSFEDGRYVFLHVVQTLNNGEFRYVTADIFDTDDDGKLIEHWDMIAEMVDETVSGHSQVDGPTEPTDLHKTEQNKRLVRNFLDDVLIAGKSDKLTDYVSSETYTQHNPLVDDGIAVGDVHGYDDCFATVVSDEPSRLGRALDVDVGHGEFHACDLWRAEEGEVARPGEVLVQHDDPHLCAVKFKSWTRTCGSVKMKFAEEGDPIDDR